uniref:Solute carrier family 18 member B1 n=1 Tax=Neolamprologus brichardi TaxID=32507 RepID=A0A3Q4GUI9_NEOBR
MDQHADPPTRDPPHRFTRKEILTLISVASVNFGSMICYSILGPFFPTEVSSRKPDFLYHRAALLYLVPLSLFISSAFPLILAGSCLLCRFLDRAPAGPIFISLCFIVRSLDAVGFGAATMSAFAITAQIFPNNVATVLGILEIFAGLGLILGPPLGGWLYQTFGYTVPFLSLGCLLLIMVPFNIYVLPSIGITSFFLGDLKLVSPQIYLNSFTFTASALGNFTIMSVSLSSTHRGIGHVPNFWILFLFCFLHLVSCGCWSSCLFVCCVVFFHKYGWMKQIFYNLVFPHSEIGFEEGLSTLGMVSGLYEAVWCTGTFYGPIVGGIIVQQLGFEWAAVVQGALWIRLKGTVCIVCWPLWQRSPC